MADSYDQAATQIDQTKAGLLAAIAQHGSAGRQAYEQAQADIGSQKQAAIASALAEAGRRGAPEQMLDSISHTVGSEYDRRLTDIGQARAQSEASFANMGAANQSYFDQAKASIPALRTYSQAKAAEQAQDIALEQRKLDLESRSLDLREAELGGGGGGGSLISSLNKQFGGVAGGNRALIAEARNFVNKAGGKFGSKGTSALLERFDQELGLPPGYTKSLLPPAKGKTAAKGTAGERTRARQQSTLKAVERRHGSNSKTMKAITFITSQTKSLSEALAALDEGFDSGALTTPGGAPLNKTRLRTYLKSYYA